MKSGKKAGRDKRREQQVDSQNQGEGDRRSARRFNDAQREFVESDEGQEAIREGASETPDEDEEEELREAEAKAGRRARENDPEEKLDHGRPAR